MVAQQVLAANAEQVARKKGMQQCEIEEEARIADYNRRKLLRDQAIQEEKDQTAQEKEREIARMRAAQEKAADKQAELDELRARRHAEAAEREWRTQEAVKAARDKVCSLQLLAIGLSHLLAANARLSTAHVGEHSSYQYDQVHSYDSLASYNVSIKVTLCGSLWVAA